MMLRSMLLGALFVLGCHWLSAPDVLSAAPPDSPTEVELQRDLVGYWKLQGDFRYAGVKKWIDCGRVGPHKTTGVMGLIVHQGHLYAGTSTYDWPRVFSGEYQPARVYRYEWGTTWTDCGQPSEMLRINCMATYGVKLYVGGDRGLPPPGEKQWTGRPYRVHVWEGETKWSVAGSLPAEPPKNCSPHAMAVHDGKLYVGYQTKDHWQTGFGSPQIWGA